MNAVEIEEAVSELFAQPFAADDFPYAFLEAFGNKSATLKKLRRGESNKSDVPNGVLQRNHIHVAVSEPGQVDKTMDLLRQSAANTRWKARFILATDGETLHAEELNSDEAPIVCEYENFSDHFGFFLPLAGISTVKAIRESSFDIKATGRLNKLYVQLLEDNPDWAKAERRPDMNHFMARLIFCFFAEDTDIFHASFGFTDQVEKMSDGTNTHDVIGEIFRAMNTPIEDRKSADIKSYANPFPYVNGGLFSGSTETPKFTKIARAYLLNIGKLDWQKINPDIFGSMIQAVADDEERGALGMHYTSVPNILKVLNPLFLDDLREKLEEAGDNARKLLNLRNRIAKIRVFDPACGSGNFLVIAYKEMRAIEAQINQRRAEADRSTDIPLTNFRGIELRDFPAEIARLALIIAEYQSDVLYRGQKLALNEFLPLDKRNWIVCGNALRLNWLQLMDVVGTGVKHQSDDLFHTPLDQTEIDFEHEGGETYICGNPPYLGSSNQDRLQKSDLENLFNNRTRSWKNLDYVSAWFLKASDFLGYTDCAFAFVSTNSICQGQMVPLIWPIILDASSEISFAHQSFKWQNLASKNAGVTVIIVGVKKRSNDQKTLFSLDEENQTVSRKVDEINPYLVPGRSIIVEPSRRSISNLFPMLKGNQPSDGGHLSLSQDEFDALIIDSPKAAKFLYKYIGSAEMIKGFQRYCIWIGDNDVDNARSIIPIARRVDAVREMRNGAKAPTTRAAASSPHRFIQIQAVGATLSIVAPRVSSENREFLPVSIFSKRTIVSDGAQALYDAPLWNMALIASRIHLVWIATVCGKMKTDFRYSNTLGWNTFPVPPLTEKNKADLTRCAEDILLAREHYFPATIADMYDPKRMDNEFPLVREAHEKNDETLERIYIGRRFKNDTERLEKLFELYTKMTSTPKKVSA
ncbi:MAG: DNA methyltransferase [Pseudomonadota bacterium]